MFTFLRPLWPFAAIPCPLCYTRGWVTSFRHTDRAFQSFMRILVILPWPGQGEPGSCQVSWPGSPRPCSAASPSAALLWPRRSPIMCSLGFSCRSWGAWGQTFRAQTLSSAAQSCRWLVLFGGSDNKVAPKGLGQYVPNKASKSVSAYILFFIFLSYSSSIE